MENMESPRQHLRSSQSKRKVRFRHNNTNNLNNNINTTDNNNNKINTMSRKQIASKDTILEHGLDLSLFEGPVDRDLICAICRRVFVQPEVSLCQHVFCSSCLHDNVSKNCPTCSIPLDRTPINQPPVHLRLKLLELVIHCDHKCGQVLPLGKLPRHVSDECPNTPVPCLYSKKSGTGGCQIKVKRCQLQEHIKECDWRPVQCDACGERTVFLHLVNHQKKSRCVENRIRNQLVQAVKCTNQDAIKHRKGLEHQRVKMESHQRREEIDHARRLQSLKIQRRQATWHPSQRQQHHQPHQFFNIDSPQSSSTSNDYSNNSSSKNSSFTLNNNENKKPGQTSLMSKLHPNSTNHSGNNSSLAITSNNNNNNNVSKRPHSQQASERIVPNSTTTTTTFSAITATSHSDNNSVQCENTNKSVFVTSVDTQDEENGKAQGVVCSVPPSRETGQGQLKDFQFTCRSCHKRVRESCNKPNACRWHAGPIIELFGGTCYTCGRLDYQHGCVVGYHEM